MTIKDNIDDIKKSLPKDVTLIAVSKTRTIDEIKVAYDAGLRHFGENKVQEFLAKKDALPKDIVWHIIGKLQKNKVKYLVGNVDLIHSLDSMGLLDELEKQFKSKNQVAQVLIEINIGREESKAGILVEELNALLEACSLCENVKVKGLMAIIPKGNKEENLKYFLEMRSIFEDLKLKNYKNITMEYLSMGMSVDYAYAIEAGSNVVRIGEGIFGKRNYNSLNLGGE